MDVLEKDIEPVALKHGKLLPQVSSVANLPFTNYFSVDCFSHTLSTFQFVLDHRLSLHTSDLLGNISIAVGACVCVCVCEKGFEVACMRLLNQLSATSVPTVGSHVLCLSLPVSLTFPKCIY